MSDQECECTAFVATYAACAAILLVLILALFCWTSYIKQSIKPPPPPPALDEVQAALADCVPAQRLAEVQRALQMQIEELWAQLGTQQAIKLGGAWQPRRCCSRLYGWPDA